MCLLRPPCGGPGSALHPSSQLGLSGLWQLGESWQILLRKTTLQFLTAQLICSAKSSKMDCHKAGVAVRISIRITSVMERPCRVRPIICVIDFSYQGKRGGRWPARAPETGAGWGQMARDGHVRPGSRSPWLLRGPVGWLDIQGQAQQWELSLSHVQK